MWVITIAVLGWVFIKGLTTKGSDGRTEILLAAVERDQILAEMRQLLKAVDGVVRELGEPIETKWLMSGSINVSGDSGNADLKIPVSGTKKSGAVYAVAVKRLGKWDFTALEVEIEGETKKINLLTPSSE